MVARDSGTARREALLDAALACFEARGLVRTGIEDIRKAAGASPSSVYHLFQGLPDLIAALLERTFVRRYAWVTARVVRTRTPRTAVHTLVEAHLAWVFAHPIEARFMYRALALDLDGDHRSDLRARKDKLRAELVAHLASVGIGSDDGMLDIVLLGTTHQACRTWLTMPGIVDAAWMSRTLPELAWQSVRRLRSTPGSTRARARSRR